LPELYTETKDLTDMGKRYSKWLYLFIELLIYLLLIAFIILIVWVM